MDYGTTLNPLARLLVVFGGASLFCGSLVVWTKLLH